MITARAHLIFVFVELLKNHIPKENGLNENSLTIIKRIKYNVLITNITRCYAIDKIFSVIFDVYTAVTISVAKIAMNNTV